VVIFLLSSVTHHPELSLLFRRIEKPMQIYFGGLPTAAAAPARGGACMVLFFLGKDASPCPLGVDAANDLLFFSPTAFIYLQCPWEIIRPAARRQTGKIIP